MLDIFVTLACLLHGTLGASSSLTQPTSTTPAASPVAVATATASPTVSLGASLPSQVPLPPVQAWCPSQIYCAGSLLQTVNLASVYADPKTFVDKPTNKSSQGVLSDFNALNSTGSITEGAIVDFVDSDFRGEGLELEGLVLSNFNSTPAFLDNVVDPLLKAWAQTVHGYWAQLIRTTNSSNLCAEGTSTTCESSLIPLNHTFVVPGGRFREQYYWDTYWIIEGLLESELFDIAKDSLQNFMDELETIGFIPNGGRIYYLNRSQPPMFIHMLSNYIQATNDTSILTRALPLAETELKWWQEHRTVNVTSPFTNQTHAMAHYAVTNTAPRPESYLTDYLTANDPTLTTPLSESQRDNLYAELASGAETGWDYSSRWLAQPLAPAAAGLRTLNVRNTIPICLNSILYNAHSTLASLYGSASKKNSTTHLAAAASLRAGILDLFWDSSKLAFYDFNLSSNARNDLFSAATFYPLWNGIIPDEILSSSANAFSYFSGLNLVLNRYNGTLPTTFLTTGLQWDAPNAWPPHQYVALQALRVLPSNITSGTLPVPATGQSTFSLIPAGQLGLSEAQLPPQTLTLDGSRNASQSGSSADLNKMTGTVINGGNTTDGEGWAATLQRELANRYFASALCSWHATGGSIPNILPRLSDAELNVTLSINNTGNMFEKFSNLDIDSAGRGGEYTVQAGFGWTNGVVLWVASNYGKLLVAPQCPNLLLSATIKSATSKGIGSYPLPSAVLVLAMIGSIVLLLS